MTSEKMCKIRTNLLMFIAFCMCSAGYGLTVNGIQDYFPLYFDNHSDPLLCHNNCSMNPSECCRCNAVSCWQINNDICDYNVSSLYVEYLQENGTSILLVRPEDADADAFTVKHTNGYTRELPANLCKFSNIVLMDFSDNRIVDISGISCLRQLEYLNLDGNHIQHLSRDKFQNMTKLRTVRMRNNRILDIGPYTFDSMGPDFPTLFVDVSGNPFDSIDITNIILPRFFCKLYIENVTVANITNLLNFTVDRNKTYGTGFVTFKTSYLDSFPNFTRDFGMGFDEVFKYVSMQIEYEESTMKCDCKMYDLMKHIPYSPEVFRSNFIYQFDNFTCARPDELKNTKLVSLQSDGLLHKLTCEIEECPYLCNCYDQPYLDRVVVNCTGKGMTELPRFVPAGYWGHGVHLLLDNNNITSIGNREYLDRVTVLDLANNMVESVSDDVFKNLPSTATIIMSNHSLSSLPATITYMDLAGLHLGNVTVECNCDNLWLLSWRKFRQDRKSNDTEVNCVIDGKLYQVESVHEEWLGCEPSTSNEGIIITISITSFIGLVIFVLCLALLPCFKYRLFDLKRWLRTSCRNEKRVFCYDIFISFDDEDNGILFKWVKDTMITQLRELRYICYVPFLAQYENIGYPREELTIEAISKSRVFIIILSDNYCSENSQWTNLEQSYIWKEHKQNYNNILIVLNFDHFNMKDVKLKSLKTLLRVKDVIPFVDKEHDPVEEIVKRLPTPMDVANNQTEEPDRDDLTGITTEVRYVSQQESVTIRAGNGASGSNTPPFRKISRRQKSKVYPCAENQQSLNYDNDLESLDWPEVSHRDWDLT